MQLALPRTAMNRITTVLLALLVATQVPNGIEKGSELVEK